MTSNPAPLAALLLLAACTHGSGFGPAADTVSRAAPMGPPQPAVADDSGACWAVEVTPAVYEQIEGEIQVVPETLWPDGITRQPAVFRKTLVPRIVQERGEVRFKAPCPADMTPEFISSLQRALAARGYFSGNVTGDYDAPTAAAVRQYQTERGLDSNQVSLDSARALGLAAVDVDALSAE